MLLTLTSLLLTAPFWVSGLSKAARFRDAVEEMRHLGLPRPAPLAIATIVLQLGASAMIVSRVFAPGAALALIAFTLLASLLAHPFWIGPRQDRRANLIAFSANMGLVGGLALLALEAGRGPWPSALLAAAPH